MTTIPDNLPVSTPYRDELQRRLDLGGAGVPIDLGRETTFEPSSLSAFVAPNAAVRIKVYGEAHFKDRVDHGGTVEIWRRPDGQFGSWTKSTAWDGRKFVDLPEGARQRIADKVFELLGDIDWDRLSEETQHADHAREINRHLGEARGSWEKAEQLRKAGPTILQLSRKGVANRV